MSYGVRLFIYLNLTPKNTKPNSASFYLSKNKLSLLMQKTYI